MKLVVFVLLAAALWEPVVWAQVNQDAEIQALVQRLTLDRATAVVVMQKRFDANMQELFDELDRNNRELRQKERALRTFGSGNTAGGVELANLKVRLAAVDRARQNAVDELSRRDRQFAAEIAEYRRQVLSIAGSPDPRKRAELKRYADGDRADAFRTLLEIQRAETKALAAGWSELATLALERHDLGEMSALETLRVLEEADQFDSEPEVTGFKRVELYLKVGKLPEANRAAEKAVKKARDDRGRMFALLSLGSALEAAGDIAGARLRIADSARIARQLLDRPSADGKVQFDASQSLANFGDILMRSGDFTGALKNYEDALTLRRRYAAENPTNGIALWFLSKALLGSGDMLAAVGEMDAAFFRFEEGLHVLESLVHASPTDMNLLADESDLIDRLGAVLAERRDFEGARTRFAESLGA